MSKRKGQPPYRPARPDEYRSRVVPNGPPVNVNRNEMYEEALLSPSSTMDLVIQRAPDADPNLTFSAEAFESIRDAAMTWMGTRLIRHLDAGKTPMKMTASLTVTFDDETPVMVPPERQPYFITDGQPRRDAQRRSH